MNYLLIHDSIINKAKDRTLTTYKEKHHITPRCLGGTNDKENLVYLTAREHFIIHKLLVEIYPNESGLKTAVFLFCYWKSGKQERNYHIGAREYERLRTAQGIIMSERLKGCKLSEEHKAKIGVASRKLWADPEYKTRLIMAAKNRPGVSQKTRAKQSASSLGKLHSEETKIKMSKIGVKRFEDPVERAKVSARFKGSTRTLEQKTKMSVDMYAAKRRRVYNPETKQNKFPKPEQLQELLDSGWVLGRCETKQR